jgi:hypothetical protein
MTVDDGDGWYQLHTCDAVKIKNEMEMICFKPQATGGINQTYIPLYFFSGGTVMDEMKESGGGFYFFWFWWVNSHPHVIGTCDKPAL